MGGNLIAAIALFSFAFDLCASAFVNNSASPSTGPALTVKRCASLGGYSPDALAQELILAMQRGDGACVRESIESGANLTKAFDNGWTSIHHAASIGDLYYVEGILSKKDDAAFINSKTWIDQTALHIAAAEGHITVIDRLVLAGANLEAPDGKGDTPLIAAVAEDRLSAAQRLIHHRALLEHRGRGGGMTALLVATARGNHEMVSVLLSCGAKLSAEDGETAMKLAKSYPLVIDALQNTSRRK